MDILSRFYDRLTGGVPQLQRDETDNIFPVHFLDQAGIIHAPIINYTFRFNDVLEPGKLHDSLAKLFGMEDWRKLGGRLRKGCERLSIGLKSRD